MTEIEIEVKFKPIKDFLKKYWVPLLLLVVFILSMYIRLFNFHWPYLLNIDSYFQYRRMEYIINGHTELLTLERNGQLINSTDLKYDPLMIAPNGAKLQFTAYQYFGAYTYMLIHLLFPNLPFWRFLIYLPAFLASLMVIPAYYLGKVIYDRKAGIIFAFLSVFNPAIMSRTLGGDPDSDAWVLLWPLIVLALYFITYKTIDGNLKNKKSIILSILTGIAFTIFAYSWVSWYIFYLIIGFVVLVSILKYILRENREQIIHILLSTFIIFLTFFIISYPISGLEKINANIFGPFNSLKLKSETGQFPNVYVQSQSLCLVVIYIQLQQESVYYCFYLEHFL
ncbi:MAG: hypothetical protein J7L15_07155 [Clostridiales bacterium]|nr:hypothetical protein [Clostridiales bacterium]